MIQFPSIFELMNTLRMIPIKCIVFNDCTELGIFDGNKNLFMIQFIEIITFVNH